MIRMFIYIGLTFVDSIILYHTLQICLRNDTFFQTEIKLIRTDVGLAHISRQTTTYIRGALRAVVVVQDMIRVKVTE
jgi:hypothetical protein